MTYTVDWSNEALAKINTLRVHRRTSERALKLDREGCWLITACVGEMLNGDEVNVKILPLEGVLMPVGRYPHSIIRYLMDAAREQDVFLQGLGVFREGVIEYVW